jgi:hypothetical protein
MVELLIPNSLKGIDALLIFTSLNSVSQVSDLVRGYQTSAAVGSGSREKPYQARKKPRLLFAKQKTDGAYLKTEPVFVRLASAVQVGAVVVLSNDT